MYAQGMAGLGKLTSAQCAADSVCGPLQKAWCYSGGYFQADCQRVRDGMFAPPTYKPPVLTAGGDVAKVGGGGAVATAEDAQAVIDKQIADAQAAMIVQNQENWRETWAGYVGDALPEGVTGLDALPLVAVGIAAVAVLMLVRH